MRFVSGLIAIFCVVLFASPARAEPGPCQEKDIKAKAACLDVWVNRLKAESAQSLPRGTVIAWRPSIEDIDKASGTVQIPRGWDVCDLRSSVTPGSAYLKGVSVKEYVDTFDPQDPDSKAFHGGKPAHQHAVAIPGQTVDQRDQLRYGDGDQTHAANTFHGHSGTTSNEPNDPPYVKVIWLCAKADQPIAGWNSNDYGGDRITIARKGTGFSDPIERSYVACNAGPGVMTVEFRPLPTTNAAGGVEEGAKIEPGECVGMDRPTWLRVTSLTGGATTVEGVYYALRPGTFPKDGVKFRREQAQARLAGARPIGIRDLGEVKVDCVRLPASSPLRKDYYSSCKIPLPQKSDYRLCFPQNFVDQPEGKYAFGAIRLIVDSSLINKGFPQIGPDLRSAAVQNGCIDLWSTGEAVVLIAPADVAPPWDPKLVKSVRVSIRETMAAK